MSTDPIYTAFLRQQFRQAKKLVGESDLLHLAASVGREIVDLCELDEDTPPPNRYLVSLYCKGVVREADGEIRIAQPALGFKVGITFPPDYLRRILPERVVTLFGPTNIFHPNTIGPLVCMGHIRPATGLLDLIYQLYEIFTYFRWASHDFLNGEAAQWARNNQHLFPVDRRPLKWRRPQIEVSRQEPSNPRAEEEQP